MAGAGTLGTDEYKCQPIVHNHEQSGSNVGEQLQDAIGLLPLSEASESKGAYSIPDVFKIWQNPILKRQAVQQPHQSSHSLSAAADRQVGGGKHIPIASFDIGTASPKRRRAEMESGRGGNLPADTKRITADVKLTVASLQKLRVCGQFDCRVIVCTLDEPDSSDGPRRLLVAIDQHAADERVQLERLTSSVYGATGDQRHFDTVQCDGNALWAFDPHELPLLLEHKATLKAWGFVYTVPRPKQQQQAAVDGDGIHDGPPDLDHEEGLVRMHSVPRFAGVTLAQMHLRKIVKQLNDGDDMASASFGAGAPSRSPSSSSFKPTAIAEVLAYRACHSAVRFGDQLTGDECRRIVSQLAGCRLPFQCAHGRPTLHPVIAL